MQRKAPQTYVGVVVGTALFGILAACVGPPTTSRSPEAVAGSKEGVDGSISVRTLPTPPVSPAAETWLFGRLPTILWRPVPGASHYQVQFARDSSFREIFLNTFQEASRAPRLRLDQPVRPGDRLFFRVRAIRDQLSSPWSNGEHTVELARPEPLRPEGSVGPEKVVFTWKAVPGASSYDFVLMPEGADAKPVFASRVPGADQPAIEFARPSWAPGTYRLQVRGRQGDVVSEWSESATFLFEPDVGERVDTQESEAQPEQLPAPAPILAIANDPHSDEVRLAVSPDGRYLAIGAIDKQAGVTHGGGVLQQQSSDWRIHLMERTSEGLEFRPLPGSGLRKLPAWSIQLSWLPKTESPGGGLVLGTVAPGSSAGAEGELYRLEAWPGGLTKLLPSRFRMPIVSLSLPRTGASPRFFFETRPEGLFGAHTPKFALPSSRARSLEMAGDGEIWSMRADGTGLKLHGPGREPAISPKGEVLAYLAAGASGAEVHLRSLATNKEEILLSEKPGVRGLEGLNWSPWGRSLALARDTGDGYNIVAVELETEKETQITTSNADDLSPVFLPSMSLAREYDGVLFTSKREGSWDLFFAEFPSQ